MLATISSAVSATATAKADLQPRRLHQKPIQHWVFAVAETHLRGHHISIVAAHEWVGASAPVAYGRQHHLRCPCALSAAFEVGYRVQRRLLHLRGKVVHGNQEICMKPESSTSPQLTTLTVRHLSCTPLLPGLCLTWRGVSLTLAVAAVTPIRLCCSAASTLLAPAFVAGTQRNC